MQPKSVQTPTETVSLLLMGLGSILFTTLGVLGERAGVTNVLLGDPVLGAWEIFMGACFLFFGVYLLGYKQVAAHVRERVA